MKKSFLLLIGIVFITFSGINAQKYGHINGDEVFAKMEEAKKADTELKKYVKGYEDEIKKMQDEYASKAKEYKASEKTMTDVIKKSRVDDLNALNEKLQKFQVSAQEDVIKKRTELYKPVNEKFKAALKKVAKKNGYKFIIDKRYLLYSEDGYDATKAVEKELGIK